MLVAGRAIARRTLPASMVIQSAAQRRLVAGKHPGRLRSIPLFAPVKGKAMRRISSGSKSG